MLNPHRPYTFDRVVRIVLTLVTLFGALYLLNLLKGALLPFLIAWLIAYLLEPIVGFFQRKVGMKSRPLAVASTLLTVVGVLAGVGFLFIPSIITEVDKTHHLVVNFLNSNQGIPFVHEELYRYIKESFSLEQLSGLLDRDGWQQLAEKSLTQLWSIITGSVNQIMNIVAWFIVLLYLIFIMLDYNTILTGFKNLIPQAYREITLSILQDVEEGMNRYFRGQSLIALIVGILFSIGFLIIKLPLAIPLGLFIGLLNLVPYLQIVGILPTILLCLLRAFETGQNFWIIFLLAMAVFAVVQLLQDMIITPHIMGKVTGLNPAVILLSLSIWGSLMGMIGMIIALPLTSLLLAYYTKYIAGEYMPKKDEVKPIENKDDTDM